HGHWHVPAIRDAGGLSPAALAPRRNGARGIAPREIGLENSGENIAKGVARSAALLITARLATRLIDFVTLIVLGHLLTPVDFGLVAIAMTVMQITEAIL